MLFWAIVGPALALGLLSLAGDPARARYVRRRLAGPPAADPPPVTVIVPVKGSDEGLRENLKALASLEYPDYELIVVAWRPEDLPDGVVPSRARVVFASDTNPPPESSEKIRNLLAAVNQARPDTEVFAFADSDGRVSPGWLLALAQPLAEDGVGAATGYRWHVPDPPDLWSLLRSVWNAVAAGSLGPGDNPFAWGGAMAIRREAFKKTRVADYWRGAISDDYALAAAVKDAGLRVAYAPGALVAATDHTSRPELFEWIGRQLAITRVYRPALWRAGLAAHLLYCAAMLASLAVTIQGNLTGVYTLVAQLFLGMAKGANRLRLAKLCLPGWRDWFARHGWVHVWWTPLAAWVWLYGFIASAGTRAIVWRGRRYRLDPPAYRRRPSAPANVVDLE